MALYDVYLRGSHIDTVYRKGKKDESGKVKRDLIKKDKKPRLIIVKMRH